MTMSTGDNRRSPQKSTTAAATGGKAPETSDEPVGGVLPVKKTARPAAKTAANGARTASSSNGTGKSNGTAAPTKKATPAKATTPAKAAKSTAGTTRPAAKSAPRSETAKVEAAVLGRTPSRATSVGKARRPVTAVRPKRNWGAISLYALTAVVALGIIFYGAWPSISKGFQKSWQERAAAIPGIHDYLKTNPEWFTYDPNVGNHKSGSLTYPIYPPVGGVHNPTWQSCMGDVYNAQIPNEQAVHALEHGTVWITYNPSLPQDQIDKLAKKVQGREMMMMSPYPDLDSNISLQAWGYQLKVDNAGDKRIDDFINALRVNATQEPQAGCSGGITDTGTVPLDLAGTGM